MNILILDFGDSFTYNILNEFLSLGVSTNVRSVSKFNKTDIKNYDAIVFGPGPGTIENYTEYFSLVGEIVSAALSGEVKLMGICLGHQLIHHYLKRSIVQIQNPVHGQSISISLPGEQILNKLLRNKSFDVQLYNSWVVELDHKSDIFDYELIDPHGRVMASFSDNITTYQFHPESIGTSCPKAFLSQILV